MNRVGPVCQFFAFPAAIAVGGVIGMTAEEAPDWLALPPFFATTFGLLTITPALAIMAWGSMRASVLPKYASAIMFVAAVLLPLSMFLGGNVFGEIGFTGTVALFGVAWIVIGIILTRTNEPQLSRP
jgi:hypothetical protein